MKDSLLREKDNEKNKGWKPKKVIKSKNKKESAISRVQKSRFFFKILGNHTLIDRS